MENIISDERGFVVDLPIEGVKHIALNMINVGYTKGNHYHKEKIETFIVISGLAEFIIENINTKEQKIMVLKELENIVIDKEFSHKVKNVGNCKLYLLQVADQAFSPKDTFKYEVVLGTSLIML